MNLPFFKSKEKPEYLSIVSLVLEISGLLKKGDYEGLANLIEEKNAFSRHCFAIMQDVEKRYKYSKILNEEIKKQGAPKSGFTMGGCSVELGHTHIQFELKGGWRLSKIWMCK